MREGGGGDDDGGGGGGGDGGVGARNERRKRLAEALGAVALGVRRRRPAAREGAIPTRTGQADARPFGGVAR